MMSATKTFTALVHFAIKAIGFSVLASCLTPIEIDTKYLAHRLVVSGQISPLPERNYIQLGITAEKEQLPAAEPGAAIFLYDDEGNSFSYIEDTAKPGTYFLKEATGIPGKTYHVRITLQNGDAYESAPEKIPEHIGENTYYYNFKEEEKIDFEGTVSRARFMKIYSSTILPSTSAPLYEMWDVEEVYKISPTDFPDIAGYTPPPCYITQRVDPQYIVLFNGAEVNEKMITDQLLASREVDLSFHDRHYFNIHQYSMSFEAYDYWRKISVVANQGSIFDTPPAEVPGNIHNTVDASKKALGYFQAVNLTQNRFFTLKEDLPFPLLIRSCAYGVTATSYPWECLDCSKVSNSSFIRPPWF